jgi:NADH:ubiquinone oxidoreductase subunit K
MHPLELLIMLGALLLTVGLAIVIIKRNTIMMLIGIDLMLNASNLNFIAFNQLHPESMDGQMSALFIIIVAVCETAVGLALVLRVYRHYQTSIPDDISELKG